MFRERERERGGDLRGRRTPRGNTIHARQRYTLFPFMHIINANKLRGGGGALVRSAKGSPDEKFP